MKGIAKGTRFESHTTGPQTNNEISGKKTPKGRCLQLKVVNIRTGVGKQVCLKLPCFQRLFWKIHPTLP